jgi:hypothetical protein
MRLRFVQLLWALFASPGFLKPVGGRFALESVERGLR